MIDLWLTDAEIDDICWPLTQPAAQVRFLRHEKHLYVDTKKNGRALVIRSHAEAVFAGRADRDRATPSDAAAPAAEPQPNIEGFMKLVHGGKRNGSPKKVQPA